MARKPKNMPAPVAAAPDVGKLQRAYDAACDEAKRLNPQNPSSLAAIREWQDACADAARAWIALKAAREGKAGGGS